MSFSLSRECISASAPFVHLKLPLDCELLPALSFVTLGLSLAGEQLSAARAAILAYYDVHFTADNIPEIALYCLFCTLKTMITALFGVSSLRRTLKGKLMPGLVLVPGCWAGCEALLPGWQGPVLGSAHAHSHEVGGVLAVMLLAT